MALITSTPIFSSITEKSELNIGTLNNGMKIFRWLTKPEQVRGLNK